MKVAIRADASFDIGSGHVVRTSALADEFLRRGAEIHYICRAHPGNYIDWLKSKNGFHVHELPENPNWENSEAAPPHAAWLGEDLQTDAQQTQAVLQKIGNVDWLIVDHYALDARWESALRGRVKNIFVIDDLADRIHDCDALLDQNYYRHGQGRYDALIPQRARKFLGPRFALLREEFAKAQAKAPQNAPERVAVFFGASDASAQTLRVAEILKRDFCGHGVEFRFLLGALNRDAPALRELTRGQKHLLTVEAGFSMFDEMARADVFIGAGGTTSWERSLFGLPSLVISVAQNQERIAREFAEAGAQIYIGRDRDVSDADIAAALHTLLSNPALRAHLARTAAGLVRSDGVKNLADSFFTPTLMLRRALDADCDALHAWRNHPDTRRFTLDPREIPLTEHRQWFARMQSRQDTILLVAESEDRPVGVLRLDRESEQARVSIYLVPGLSGRGYGLKILQAGEEWLRAHWPDVKALRAEVMKDNAPSHALFAKAGYLWHHTVYSKEIP